MSNASPQEQGAGPSTIRRSYADVVTQAEESLDVLGLDARQIGHHDKCS